MEGHEELLYLATCFFLDNSVEGKRCRRFYIRAHMYLDFLLDGFYFIVLSSLVVSTQSAHPLPPSLDERIHMGQELKQIE